MKKINNITGSKYMLPVCDLKREYRTLKPDIDRAVARVLGGGWYVLGKELELFEKEFAVYCGSGHAVGVANGTEAIQIALMALGIGRGDEVITAVNTAIPTAMAIVAAGATPAFVDVDENTGNIDPAKIEYAVTKATKAIIPVHLYGNPCNIAAIMKIAARRKLHVVEDACQAHGASYGGKKAGTFGNLGAFSFYPTKNLGCFGDGGIIVTDKAGMATKARLLRNYGQSTRYFCDIEGINSRLDEVQAAILRVKLAHLDENNKRRLQIAGFYDRCLKGVGSIKFFYGVKGAKSVFHLYVMRCDKRDEMKDYLAKRGIETQIHYPVPLHMQKAFRHLGYKKGDYPVAERIAGEILSLPMFPSLKDSEVKDICRQIKEFCGRRL